MALKATAHSGATTAPCIPMPSPTLAKEGNYPPPSLSAFTACSPQPAANDTLPPELYVVTPFDILLLVHTHAICPLLA